MTNNSSRLVGILGAAAILSSACVAGFSSGSSETGCIDSSIGNGYCTQENNNGECDYDGGDCCECTCEAQVDDDDFTGCREFACIDPEASCVDDDEITAVMVENCEWAAAIGNGYCNQGNNMAECGYDGGDCCTCTCVGPDDESVWCQNEDFACIDPDAPCVGDDDVTDQMAENCETAYLGNGWCDQANNNEICGYDGGDCCVCTCVNPDDYADSCNHSPACIDPAAPCVDDDDITIDMVENCGHIASVGNGYCDEENNNDLCGYDGGDCCECTCVEPEYNDIDDNVPGCDSGFACIDPSAPCVDDDDITLDIIANCDNSVSMGDGHCDVDNNNEACAYDGGDCCECTCEDTPNQECGILSEYACIDPEAPCVDDDSFTADMIDCGYPDRIGNGWCDEINNTEQCAYDGGDCCECTCELPAGEDFGCVGQFACVDPDVACVDDDSVTVDMLENCANAANIGDGYCSDDLNTEGCAYDGGDCCSCTCEGFDEYACQSFACIDPAAPCVDDDSITVDMFESCNYPKGIGNGWCDEGNNIEECAYDGGDCCACTCEYDGIEDRCERFLCIDPNAACVDDDDITVDMAENCGNPSGLGDGWCDSSNNNADCGYDGGDCCSCTCDNTWAGTFSCVSFDCQDPSAACLGEETTGDDDVSFGDYGDDDELTSYAFASWEETETLDSPYDAVEVGTKTEVSVTATAYDERPGSSSGDVGCGEDGGGGCAPANTRDGVYTDIESRWSCAATLVPEEGPCQIEFSFAEPQNIVEIQVAFWKGDERPRTLGVYVDGELVYTHESYADATFNTLGVIASGANTVMLESAALLSNEWISLIEVFIFVTP